MALTALLNKVSSCISNLNYHKILIKKLFGFLGESHWNLYFTLSHPLGMYVYTEFNLAYTCCKARDLCLIPARKHNEFLLSQHIKTFYSPKSLFWPRKKSLFVYVLPGPKNDKNEIQTRLLLNHFQ